MEKNEYTIVYKALDELMVCKCRSPLTPEQKDVWGKRIAAHRVEAVLFAIERMIRAKGEWPEVAGILEGCGEWCRQNAAMLQDEALKKATAALLAMGDEKKQIGVSKNG